MAPRRIGLHLAAIAAAAPALWAVSAGCAMLLDIQEGQLGDTGSSGAGGAGGGAGEGSSRAESPTTSAGAGGGDGGGECASDTDCPASPFPECRVATCSNGACTFVDTAAGTPLSSQIAGDCKQAQCDGHGGVVVVDADDPFDDGKQCTSDTCAAGVASNPPLDAGAPCQEGGGVMCNGLGACVECASDADCPGEICKFNACVPNSCADGVANGGETDIDCGGACPKCPDGKTCGVDPDCQSGVCELGVCKAPNCTDATHNGSETDVDCGGACPPCAVGKTCAVGADCKTGVCIGAICQGAKCTDGVKNGTESDVDCGGTCSKCPDGKSCSAGGDCTGGVCNLGICCTPTPPAVVCASICGVVTNNCSQAVDCGGCVPPATCVQHQCACAPDPTATTCSGKCGTVTDNCGQAVDCGACPGPDAGPTCDANGVKDGSETDIDCGGGCTPCGACGACLANADCGGGLTCTSGICGPCGKDGGT